MKKKISGIFVKGTKKMAACIAAAGIVLTSFSAISVDAATSSSSLNQQIAAAKQELEDAKTNQSEAEEKYNQGYLGFIDWMLEQDNITTTQKYDLNQAKTVITKAQEEDFSKWGLTDSTLADDRDNKVCVVSDLYDATSIPNIRNSITIMKSVNSLRESDDNYVGDMKRNPSYTNFYLEAVAQTGADRGAGTKRHAYLQVSCENLAFGYSSPAYAWYSEKSAFNTIKTSLGITTLTSESDISAIRNEASTQGKTIGHYANLFYAADQVMGAGYTNYGGTSCYNASALSDLSSEYEYYTIDEFETLFNQYYATIDPDVLQEKVDDAQTKLDNLQELYYNTCSGHTYGDVTHVNATCTDEGYDAYVCSKCGYTKKENVVAALGHSLTNGVCDRCGITTVKEVSSVNLYYVNGSTTYSNSTYDQTYEVGQKLSLKISFTSASRYPLYDKFVIDIKDSTIISYEASTNSTGTMTMLSIGETTFDVYPKDDPSQIKTYTINVTDVGGHDFVIAEAKEGEAETTETCTKCGLTKTITVPTSITRIWWCEDNYYQEKPAQYEVGDEVALTIIYSPTSVDNNKFTVEISDTSVATYTRANNYKGTITMLKPGDVTVTVYATYNPSVKKVYEFEVTEVGGHDFIITPAKEGESETIETCSNCGQTKTVTVPASITKTVWYKGSSGTYEPVQYEVGDEVTLTIIYSPTSVDNNEFTVEISDTSVATYTRANNYKGTITMLKPGNLTVTVYATYNPSVKKVYNLTIVNDGETESSTTCNHTPAVAVKENVVAATCSKAGLYDETVYCSVCGTEISRTAKTITKLAHSYKTVTTKATTSKTGSIVESCTACGDIKSNTTIAYAKAVTLSATSLTYTGKALKPTVIVTDSNGKKISSSYYTVAYTNNTKVGKATVKITLKGNYTGTLTKTFKINPKATTISKLTATSKGFKVIWKKQATQTTGYEIRYSTKASMSGAKTVTVKKNNTSSTTVKKLTAKKKYYVQIRTYTTVNGTKYYSSWSKAKTVTTKK